MQEEREENNDISVAASSTFTDASSQHHSADTEAARSIREETRDEELETETKKNGNEGIYERPDPQEVEEARLRAQQPSVYAKLQGDKL